MAVMSAFGAFLISLYGCLRVVRASKAAIRVSS